MDTNLYRFSRLLLGIFDSQALITFPILIMAYVIFRQVWTRKFDLTTIFLIFVLLPILTPFLTKMAGFEYFTAMNYDLQRDEALQVSAILLIFLFSMSVILGKYIRFRNPLSNESVNFSRTAIIIVFAINFVLLAQFLESDSILQTGYGLIKQNQAKYSSLVNQIFNLSAAIMLVSINSQKRRKLVRAILIIFIALSLLYARRTMSVGLIIVLFYTLRENTLRMSHIIAAIFFAFALWFIGEVRAIGLLPYLSGLRYIDVARAYYSMPGGGANVFVGTMGVIHLLGSGKLAFPETMPILLWFQGQNESKIYSGMGYAYNGGMHIASVLYWNFGLLGVVSGGLFFGSIARSAGNSLRGLGQVSRGSLGRMLSIGFAVLLPNTIWYSPIGLVKLSIAIVIAFFLLRMAKAACASPTS